MNPKQNTSWKDMSPSDRKAAVVGLVAILGISAYLLWPSPQPQTPDQSVITSTPAVAMSSVTHTQASPAALASATQYYADIDGAMLSGVAILKSSDIHSLGKHSRRFSELVDHGYDLFGGTIAHPLGACGSAGNFARTWWHAQISAARKGGIESVPGEIQSDLDIYNAKRDECLSMLTPAATTNS
ncbi:hypothetical protein [Pseudomonas sp. SLFW]|uniref:hypothetical protein n=1 Tax=Pseudomonas sp. SLFW TaxID=2683259 RepID=UPI00141359B1|nr:hypothetical protein [Pseudomonas sp. SLFW]NBB09326.1 hypothetical protein [Pseudomonas sp. SLFW]